MAAYTGSHSAPKHAKEKIGHAGKSKAPSRWLDTSEDFTAPDFITDYSESADIYSDGDLRSVSSRTVKPKATFKEKLTHIILVIAAFFVAGAVGAAGVLFLFSQGPSEQLTKLFVRTFYSTGTKKWVPGIFMSEQEIAEALDATADTSYLQYGNERETLVSEVSFEEPDEDEETIELIDVAGANWRGKMYIVRDPSLVKLATPDLNPNGSYGDFMLISEYCNKYGAVGGITGGGFDVKVGEPFGFVIYDGKVVSQVEGFGQYVGITEDHRLITGLGYAQDAIDKGVVEGCVWGPILICEGIKSTGLGGGYSARSAIGQCADGTMLLLVVEGRSLRSLGASYQDIADFFYNQGCINAINLDSGRSAVLVHNGENVTNISIGAGIATEERMLPNAFVVLPEGSNE